MDGLKLDSLHMAIAEIPTTHEQLTRSHTISASEPSPSNRSWRIMATCLILSLIAGSLHGVSWLFPGTWYAAWMGHAALIAIPFLATPRLAFWSGMVAGVVTNACGFYWGVEALQATMAASPTVAFGMYGLLVTFEAVAFGLFCWASAHFVRRGPAYYVLIPVTWTAVEFWYPRIFAWKIGYSQLEWIELLQIAELVGVEGIGFVMTAAAAIPAVLILSSRTSQLVHRADQRHRVNAIAYCVASAALLGATLAFGSLRRQQWEAHAAGESKLKIALMQIDPAYGRSKRKLRERSLAVHDQVDLICWPETAIGAYSDQLKDFRDSDRTFELSHESHSYLEPAKDLHCHLLAGGKTYSGEPTEEGPFWMAAFLINPLQDIVGTYKKRTLMPLGEYVPGQNLYPPLREWFTLQQVIEAGKDPSPITMSGGRRLGVLMCYEDTIPQNARQTAAAGAEIFISLIQGTVFENPLTLVQHQRLAVLRAVENRRYFLRCASTGQTCVITPTGQVVADLPLHTEDTLVCEAALFGKLTLYTVLGDFFPIACSVFCIAGLVLCLRTPKPPAIPAGPRQ
jgi:apolipoprotein N-acyltransferase